MRQKRQKKKKKKRKQRCGFLNISDFAYAVRDTVDTGLNTLNGLGLGLIKTVSNKIDRVATRRIRRIVQQVRKEVESVAPKII